MYRISTILKLLSKKSLFLVFFFSIVSNIFQTLLLLSIPVLSFFYLGKSFDSKDNFIPNIIKESLKIDINFLSISYMTLAIVIISTIANLTYLFVSSNLSFDTGKKLQISAFKFFLSRPYSFFQKKNKNDIINKVIQDIIRIPHGILIPFFNIFNSFILTIIIFFTLIIINPTVAIFLTLLLSLLYFILFQKIKYKLKKYSENLSYIHKNFIEISNFIFGLNKDIRHYNRENYFLKKVEINSQNYKKIRTFLNIISLSPRYIIEGLAIFFLIIFIIYSVELGLFSKEIILEFLIILLFIVRILPHLQLIFSQLSIIQSNLTVIKGMEKYSNNSYNFKNINNSQIFNKIQLKNIYFKYNKKEIFKDLNLEIHKGEKIAIVGPNGSGKTTLVNLLSGFNMPQKGNIKINNNTLNKIYNYFGTVTTNPIILNGSLYENISLSQEIDKKIKEKIDKIIKQLNMTKIYRSYLSEKDISQKLSQGEKQLVGIARFLFFEKKILIIDEGTSNLRTELEKQFINRLINIQKNLTIIFITHRFTNLKIFEKIYKIQNKKLKKLNHV